MTACALCDYNVLDGEIYCAYHLREVRQANKRGKRMETIETTSEIVDAPRKAGRPPKVETLIDATESTGVSQNWKLAQLIPNAGIRCESDDNGALVLEKNGTVYAVNPKNFKSDADVIQAFAAGGIY